MFHRKKRRQASSSTVGNKHAQKKQRPLEEAPAPLQQQKPAVQIKLAFKDSYLSIQGLIFKHSRIFIFDTFTTNLHR